MNPRHNDLQARNLRFQHLYCLHRRGPHSSSSIVGAEFDTPPDWTGRNKLSLLYRAADAASFSSSANSTFSRTIFVARQSDSNVPASVHPPSITPWLSFPSFRYELFT